MAFNLGRDTYDYYRVIDVFNNPNLSMKRLEDSLNKSAMTFHLSKFMEDRDTKPYANLRKCLDKEKGISDDNYQVRFTECWDAFKKERQHIFQTFKTDFKTQAVTWEQTRKSS